MDLLKIIETWLVFINIFTFAAYYHIHDVLSIKL